MDLRLAAIKTEAEQAREAGREALAGHMEAARQEIEARLRQASAAFLSPQKIEKII